MNENTKKRVRKMILDDIADNKINLEEILIKNIKKIYMEFMPIEDFCNRDRIIAINAMKEACQEILRLAAENAKIDVVILRQDEIAIEFGNVINKQSILNTINEIE